jgi:hypothetical protein
MLTESQMPPVPRLPECSAGLPLFDEDDLLRQPFTDGQLPDGHDETGASSSTLLESGSSRPANVVIEVPDDSQQDAPLAAASEPAVEASRVWRSQRLVWGLFSSNQTDRAMDLDTQAGNASL